MRLAHVSRTAIIVGLGVGGAVALGRSASAQVVTCPQTSSPTAWTGSTLDTGTTKSGVIYNGTGSQLQLQPAAGLFQSTPLGISDLTVFASAADFDRDGWTDFVGTGEGHDFISVYRNMAWQWTDGVNNCNYTGEVGSGNPESGTRGL